MVFIVVQHEGCYSDQNWQILTVRDTLHDAQISGCLEVVKEAMKP